MTAIIFFKEIQNSLQNTDADAYLPNVNLSNDEWEDDNTSVSSFTSTKKTFKRKNKSHLRRNKMIIIVLNL